MPHYQTIEGIFPSLNHETFANNKATQYTYTKLRNRFNIPDPACLTRAIPTITNTRKVRGEYVHIHTNAIITPRDMKNRLLGANLDVNFTIQC